MKKIGTLNSHLSGVIAALGHMDKLVVCDAGLPIPRGMECVDLALTPNIPRFIDVVKVVLEELDVESAIVAEEMVSRNGVVYEELSGLLVDIPIQTMPHESFKQETCDNRNTVFVRTGEVSPFANVILIAGVTFG